MRRLVVLVLAACSSRSPVHEAPVAAIPVDAAAVRTPDAKGTITVTESDECGWILDMIYFPVNSVTPAEHQQPVLASTVEMLVCAEQHGQRMFWEVQGHADALEPNGLQLSEARAAYIRGELIKGGVPAVALRSIGYGASLPLDKRTTEMARAKNRRVMFVALGPRP
jgi:outer membrane protein OmpA-like peptidoglycan-associated protein